MKHHIIDLGSVDENSCSCDKCFEKVVKHSSRRFQLIKKLFPKFYKDRIEL